MEYAKRLWYRLQYSNFLVAVRFNPLTWCYIPKFKKIPKYADDWFADPYSKEYRLSFLMLVIEVVVETGEPFELGNNDNEFFV